MRILLWPVHGGYTDAFVRGDHEYLLPAGKAQDPAAIGLDGWVWPRARAIPLADLRHEDIDVAVLQRREEIALLERFAGRRPARDIPAVYLEHNAPQARIADMRHPAAGRDDLTVVHVTHFNDLFWDCGTTATRVIEHGIPDPGERYTGELPRCAVVINEATRRGRVTGTDLLPRFREAAPIDLFGMGAEALDGFDLPQAKLHDEMARRRAYLHPIRWTSLGLSLIEAMYLGMPVVALATTEVAEAVPDEAGIVSNRMDRLQAGLRTLVADADRAREAGQAARRAALERFGIDRFLGDWDALLEEVA